MVCFDPRSSAVEGRTELIAQLQRSSSITGKVVVLAIAVLAMEWGHSRGAETIAFTQNVWVGVAGSASGLGMVAIVVARLFGKRIGLIKSDRQAIFALLFMITVKVVLARVFLAM